MHDRYTLNKLRQAVNKIIGMNTIALAHEKVVDFGCGESPYKTIFTSRQCHYIGCDIDESAEIVVEVEQPIPLPDNFCEGIVSFQVLEHVWNLDWYLGECWRILKPGGWLLLSTHGSWLYHPHPTDYRRWTRDGLIREISSRGFNLKQVISIVGPLAWTTQLRLLGYHTVADKLGLFGKLLLFPIACFMNLMMIIEDRITPTSIHDVNASVYVTLFFK
jgi:SAM-dependent methyltransferase